MWVLPQPRTSEPSGLIKMPFECPKCEKEAVTYRNANESRCRECHTTVPNANLPKQLKSNGD